MLFLVPRFTGKAFHERPNRQASAYIKLKCGLPVASCAE